MGAYIIRRLLAILVLAFGVSIIAFSIIHLIPGDPVIQMIGYGQSSAAEIKNLHHQLGLDLPLPVQYVRWLGNVLHGDFGYSYYSSTPVDKLIAQNIPYTIELAVAALIVSLIVGIPVGIIAALFRGSFIDTGAMIVSLASLSIPDFWLGILLITLFSVQLHFLPVFGGTSLMSIQSLILPALALGAGTGGITARFVRASVIEAATKQHVVTARAKGLPRRAVFNRHIFRNAILPVVTVVGLQTGFLLSGTVITEVVFSRPGIGRLLVDSILQKDYLTVQALVLLITLIYTTINLIVDLIYPLIDPRIVY
jgi:ABC-type dipeptide/oligopeptide/nickel transport system permease component